MSANLLLTVWAAVVTINILPDDILLHIFLIDRQKYYECPGSHVVWEHFHQPHLELLRWSWHRLVHVCRRWRSIVFASQNFLDLTLVCGLTTPMALTGIWPPLPIIITNEYSSYFALNHLPDDYDFDAAMVHPNRVREIYFSRLSRSLFQRMSSATRMREQFPALTHLIISCNDSDPSSALPDGFLGGSAPLLQSIELNSIPFPTLPKLLLSATHLVRLVLDRIPHSGYFSPEAIVTALAGMTDLGCLIIRFKSPLSRPRRERRSPPPLVHIVLPALTRFYFYGASEYLEDFVARIDAPLLDSIYIIFFHQLIFDIPRLAQFMRHTSMFQELKEVHVQFEDYGVYVETFPPEVPFVDGSGLGISCKDLDWQLSSLAQVFTPFFSSIYTVEHLYIYEARHELRQCDIENMQWLELFHLFTAVKDLYLSKNSAPYIAAALQELVGARTTEVLPALQNILLEGLAPPGAPRYILEGIGKFVALRQLSNYPITISRWERARDRRFGSIREPEN